jgi:hypothetical protein
MVASLVAVSANGVTFQYTGLDLGEGPDPYASAVSRVVRSLAEFSRWPDESQALTLCLVGPSDHAQQIAGYSLSRGRSLRTRRYPAASLPSDRCDMIYIGRMSLEQQRMLTAEALGKPVLTIAENDPACRSRAMFCLLFQVDSLSFRMNIDAISRSPVRVDPRVLRMATNGGERS